jgi:hypothetical protein
MLLLMVRDRKKRNTRRNYNVWSIKLRKAINHNCTRNDKGISGNTRSPINGWWRCKNISIIYLSLMIVEIFVPLLIGNLINSSPYYAILLLHSYTAPSLHVSDENVINRGNLQVLFDTWEDFFLSEGWIFLRIIANCRAWSPLHSVMNGPAAMCVIRERYLV